MLKARSRLFFVTFTICWLFIFSLSALVILGRQDSSVSDPWRDKEALIHTILLVDMGLLVVGAIGIVVLVRLENAIRKGWDPHFLEVYRPGCNILEKMSLAGGGGSQITVRHANGEVQTYEATEEKANQIEVGSISHLWVIGKYVERFKLVSSRGEIRPVENWERTLLRPNSRPFATWLTIISSTLVSAYLVAYGIILMGGGSMVLPNLDREQGDLHTSDLYVGTWVNMTGLTLVLVGAALFAFLTYHWKYGWDESMFDRLSDGSQGPDL